MLFQGEITSRKILRTHEFVTRTVDKLNIYYISDQSKLTFTCSKSITETLEKGVKQVHS